MRSILFLLLLFAFEYRNKFFVKLFFLDFYFFHLNATFLKRR